MNEAKLGLMTEIDRFPLPDKNTRCEEQGFFTTQSEQILPA